MSYYFRVEGNFDYDMMPKIYKIILVGKGHIEDYEIPVETAFEIKIRKIETPKKKRSITPKIMTPKRIQNIVTRMIDGQDFYTNMSPRISRAEYNEMSKMGFSLQHEATYGAQSPTPWAVYPIDLEAFKQKALELYPISEFRIKSKEDSG